MKILINKCYGGFGLSQKAIKWLIDNKGWKVKSENYDDDSIKITKYSKDNIKFFGGEYSILSYCLDRTDKDVIECVETLGSDANGRFSDLKIIEIPDDIEYEIDEYDGIESISEKHMSWG